MECDQEMKDSVLWLPLYSVPFWDLVPWDKNYTFSIFVL